MYLRQVRYGTYGRVGPDGGWWVSPLKICTESVMLALKIYHHRKMAIALYGTTWQRNGSIALLGAETKEATCNGGQSEKLAAQLGLFCYTAL